MSSGSQRNNLWNGFLPRRAIVMARHNSQKNYPQPLSPFSVPPQHQTEIVDSLARISADLQGCVRCKLCNTRKTIVIGEGNPSADLVFIGEGPGEQEDLEGRPFIGKAGQLLDRMIEAMGLKRQEVYIMNVVKCRPPDNRNPELDEITPCSPFLRRQIEVIQPKVIVALGKFASQTLLNTTQGITSLRGHFHPYQNAKLMPTFHPSYLLRNPAAKKEVWIDLKLVANELGIQIPKR